ncbi:MAG: hypothetical protein HY540_02460 [Deltaproteobacteria bacterium]|nr:hypothetical protein [Deltaproteobacteria bacterium]
MEPETTPAKRPQIHDPTPARRKRLIDLFNAFLEDKISLAELKGISRVDMIRLAESGHVKFKHGRFDEAETIFKGLMILDHRNPYFHAMMAALHQKRGRPVEAILEYSHALKLNKHDVTSLVNRGEIYLRHNNFRKAAEDFRSAILLDEVGSNLWANRARSLVIALKRTLEADPKLNLR